VNAHNFSAVVEAHKICNLMPNTHPK